MQTDTPVDTEHEVTKIVAEAHTGAECHLLKQVLHLEVAPGAAFVIVHRPDIAGIEEDRSIERTHQPGTIFKVHLKLDVACLFYIRTAALGRPVTSRTDLPCVEGTDTVGSAHIELLGVRSETAVPICPESSCIDVGGNTALLRHCPYLGKIRLYLEKLCERILEELLVLLAPMTARQGISSRQHI